MSRRDLICSLASLDNCPPPGTKNSLHLLLCFVLEELQVAKGDDIVAYGPLGEHDQRRHEGGANVFQQLPEPVERTAGADHVVHDGCFRSDENTSELQSRGELVCRLRLEIIN